MLLQEILVKLYQIKSIINVFICWIPSHIGILGNEMADKLAKKALNLSSVSFNIPLELAEVNSMLLKFIMDNWQLQWDCSSVGRKYYAIVPSTSFGIKYSNSCRMRESTMSRLMYNYNG